MVTPGHTVPPYQPFTVIYHHFLPLSFTPLSSVVFFCFPFGKNTLCRSFRLFCHTITSFPPFIDISFIPFCPFICHSLSYYHFLLKHACTSCCHFTYIALSFIFSFRLFLSLSFIPVICTSLRYRTYLVIPFLERLFPFCNFRSFIIVSLQSSLSFPYVK